MRLTAAERQRAYRQRHPEKVLAAKLRWQQDNPEKHREMRRSIQRAYEARNPGRSIEKNAKFRTTVHGISCYLYWNAYRRARTGGLVFDLTKQWIKDIVQKGKCQVTGLQFSFENGRKPWAPSLDRVDPKQGYTTDNVRVVVWLYNAAKAEFSDDDVMVLARALTQRSQ